MDNKQSPKTERIKCNNCQRIIEAPARPTNETIVIACPCGAHYEFAAGSIRLRFYLSRRAWKDEIEARKKMGLPAPQIQLATIIRGIEGDA